MRIPRPDETFIVRVRQQDGDAVVEQPRLARRRTVEDVAEVGAVIQAWIEPAPARPAPRPVERKAEPARRCERQEQSVD